MISPVDTQQPSARAWFIWSLAAIAFSFAFFQRVSPSVMVSDLMAEFAIGGAVTGYLSALYFYPYVALQFPLGALLDRFGVRRLLASALGLAAIGSYMFASAQSIEVAYFGRLLVGIGCAVGFLASLTLAGSWFPPRKFAFMAGFVMFFGMAGGITGQAPLAALIGEIGWRNAMLAAAAFAGGLGVLVAIFVRDRPPGQESKGQTDGQNWLGFFRTLKQALGRGEVWYISVVAMSMTGPMLAFGGLWGVPYFMTEYGLEKPQAAFYASMLLVGWAVGAPSSGWISDRLGRRRLPLTVAASIQAGLVALILFAPGIPATLLVVMMFLIGLFASAMVITFALAREVSDAAIHGSVSGIVNAMTVMSGAILQPIIGLLLDWQWDGTLADGARVYSPEQYRIAFLSLLAWTGIGALLTLRLRETFCGSVNQTAG